VQDTGVILGISEAPQTVSFAAWPSASRRWWTSAPEGSGVDNLSSFIGVDGTNTTLNSGRIQINLKPLEERKISATEVIRRCSRKLAGRGHSRSSCSRCRT
jgi:multidrug efflux pump